MKKTSRAVVLHEAAKRMGYGAEIAATIQEEAFWYLDQPITRIGGEEHPDADQPAAGGRGHPATAEIAENRCRKVAAGPPMRMEQ